ncbi:MAG: UDP-galactopyranose mutase, partial [Bacillus sp. (in: firmicutes)]
DKYQGIPVGGYTQIIEKMLSSDLIDVETGVDFFNDKEKYLKTYPKIVYTGMIDQFFEYQFGTLEYRSLKFETTVLNQSNFQGNAVVNYTDAETPFTRIIEHQHFEFSDNPKTIITKEYPSEWKKGDEPYYPMNDKKNNTTYQRYKELADETDNVIFGGRLGLYKYFDMHQVIGAALSAVDREFNKNRVL